MGTRQIPSDAAQGFKKMRRYQTEAAYLKSVLLWLQGNWTEPDPPRFYPLTEVGQRSGYYSVRRTHAALNRQEVIVDQPAFLPPRNPSACRRGTQSQFDEGKIAAERTVASRNARNNSLRSVHGQFAPNQVSGCLFSKAHGAWTVRAKFYADARRKLLNII